MEEDVSRAIKQLESIAIKAMKSGYLDDAAKVMHIAEEIERVDKSGAGADGGIEDEVAQDAEVAADAEPKSDRFPVDRQTDEPDANQSFSQPTFASLDQSTRPACDPPECNVPVDAKNVVPLNRFRMKRSASLGDEMPESRHRSD